MRLEDYDRKEKVDFRGLYASGTIDQVPEDYFSDCLNIDFQKNGWNTRDGLSNVLTLGYGSGNGKVRRYMSLVHPTVGLILLILDDAGNFYTYSARTGDNATTVRFTVAGATDFSAIVMLGKIYIAPHDGQIGVSEQNLKVLIPGVTLAADELRNAGGAAPLGASGIGIPAVDSAAAGIVLAGTYQIAVTYETTSGFLTPPGPIVTGGTFGPTSFTAVGFKKIDLSNIPVGPAGTAKRHILITKAGLNEYFFVSSANGGLINNNTDTTASLNFDFTTDLVDSADYLFDVLPTIPAPLAIQDYNARLCIAGEAGNGSIIRISRPGEPEAFDAIDGIVTVNRDDGFTIRNMIVMRDVLYTWKNLGVFAVRDNGDVPSSWAEANPIDRNVNTSIHGIGEFFNLSGIRIAREWTLVVDRSGILYFDGIVRKPPITDNISDIWALLNFNYYHKVVVAIDEEFHKIYCAYPSGSATECNKLIMGDYNSCPGKIPESNSIKWSTWEFKPGGTVRNPTAIGIASTFTSGPVPVFIYGSVDGGGKLWKLDPSLSTDDSGAIESYFETSLLYWDSGMVHFFTAVRMRVIGSGTLLITLRGEDDVLTLTAPSLTLQAAPGQEKLVRFNFQNEKARLKFRLTSGNFIFSKTEFFGKAVYSMRPA